jgi:hypothetical protein
VKYVLTRGKTVVQLCRSIGHRDWITDLLTVAKESNRTTWIGIARRDGSKRRPNYYFSACLHSQSWSINFHFTFDSPDHKCALA